MLGPLADANVFKLKHHLSPEQFRQIHVKAETIYLMIWSQVEKPGVPSGLGQSVGFGALCASQFRIHS